MVHTFKYKHKSNILYFLWDIESGSLHSVDYVAFLCARKRYNLDMSQEEIADYSKIPDSTVSEIFEEFAELEADGALNAPPAIKSFHKNATFLKAMCLHICHDCNLKCEYCFASGGTYKTERDYMSLEVGKKAIDLLIAKSGIKRNLEVDFFGGEPLLSMGVVRGIVDYAKAEAIKHNKEFSFTMTTNCLALGDANIEYLNEVMDNVVLSIDGRPEIHNAVRKSINDKDVYDVILNNALKFRKVRGDKKYYARGTFTARNLDFSKDIFHLNDAGFDQISVEPVVLPDSSPMALKKEHLSQILDEYDKLAEGYLERRAGEKWFNFFHFMIDLDHGPCINKRLTGCGAGTEYIAVSPIGELYPCHQFVGEKEYYIGNVFDGITNQNIRETFADICLLTKEHCTDCPAKYYCGGGCAANAKNFSGSIDGQYEMGCILTRKRLELSLAIATIEKQ